MGHPCPLYGTFYMINGAKMKSPKDWMRIFCNGFRDLEACMILDINDAIYIFNKNGEMIGHNVNDKYYYIRYSESSFFLFDINDMGNRCFHICIEDIIRYKNKIDNALALLWHYDREKKWFAPHGNRTMRLETVINMAGAEILEIIEKDFGDYCNGK